MRPQRLFSRGDVMCAAPTATGRATPPRTFASSAGGIRLALTVCTAVNELSEFVVMVIRDVALRCGKRRSLQTNV